MDERMNKKEILEKRISTLFIMVCAGFFISYIYTVLLLKSDTVGFWSLLPILVIAGVIDGLKTITAFAKTGKKYDKKTRSRAGAVYYITLIISLLASFAFTTNQSNSRSNVEYTQSLEYKEYLETKERIETQITRKNSTFKALEEREKEKGTNYISRKTLLLEDIDKLNEKIDLLVVPDNIQEKSTHGFLASCKLIVDTFHLKISPENLKLLIFLTIVFVFEFGLGEFARYYNLGIKEYEENYGPYFPEIKIKNAEIVENSVHASSGEKAVLDLARNDLAQKQEVEKIINFNQEKAVNKAMLEQSKDDKQTSQIGFKNYEKEVEKEPKKDKYNDEDLVNYYNFMVEDAKEKRSNISKGYKAIAREIEIKESEAQKIKNALEMQGIIETNGNQTVILKMDEEMKKVV